MSTLSGGPFIDKGTSVGPSRRHADGTYGMPPESFLGYILQKKI